MVVCTKKPESQVMHNYLLYMNTNWIFTANLGAKVQMYHERS